MRSADLYVLLDRDPCPILRLHLLGGTTFDVIDPDDIVVSRDTVELLLPRDGANLREAVINIMQIVWVEVITPAS